MHYERSTTHEAHKRQTSVRLRFRVDVVGYTCFGQASGRVNRFRTQRLTKNHTNTQRTCFLDHDTLRKLRATLGNIPRSACCMSEGGVAHASGKLRAG
jgi:hypothetical protein